MSGLSYKTYVGDGTTKLFSAPDYIDSSHITVKVDGDLTEDWSWNTSSVVELDTAPGVGESVAVIRTTPTTDRLVDFQTGTLLKEADLDRNADNIFFIMQELIDYYNSTILLDDTDSTADAQGHRIINVADPEDAQDAATKNYVGSVITALSEAATITPQGYGAEGDGTTDDTSALQAAINAVPAGGILYLPNGTYLASSLTLNSSIKLMGAGTIKQKTGSAEDDTPFVTVDSDDVWFDGITFDGNKANQGTVVGADLLRFSSGADNGRVTNCTFVSSTGCCVSAYSASNLEIRNNQFSDWRSANNGAVHVQAVDASINGCRIIGNFVDGSVSGSTGIKVVGTSTYTVYDVVVEGNTVTVGDTVGTDTLGIELWSASQYGVIRGTISANTIKGENSTNANIYGVSVAGAGCRDVAVVGNAIINCLAYGIEVAGSKCITVSGNTLRQENASPAYKPGVMLNETNNSIVTGNTIDSYRVGIQIYSGNASVADASSNIIATNTIICPASLATNAIWVQSNASGAKIENTIINSNSVMGDGTVSQYGLILEVDAGSIDNAVIMNNMFTSLYVGISRGSDTYTKMTNNHFDSCTVTLGGSAGTGEQLITNDTGNGTYQFQMSAPVAINSSVMHGIYGGGAAYSGFIRLKNADYICARNAANTGDVAVLSMDAAADVPAIGDAAGFAVKSPGGIGDGAPGNVQVSAKGTGTGPTNSQLISKFIPVYIYGTLFYIPLMQ